MSLFSRVRSVLSRSTVAAATPPSGREWGAVVVREPYTGAWQKNEEVRADTALNYWAVFACTTLIASDIGKVWLRLVAQDSNGIWQETESAAFSPVLRKPNRYQTRQKFLEQWIVSKLTHGNTYVLKQRDQRGIVVALYVLDPTRVIPLVTSDGAVYYQLSRDDLAGVDDAANPQPIAPASEIIHDLMVPLFHPLVGVSPIFACGMNALQGLNIQQSSTAFFAGGSNPGGVLLAPGKISDETAKRLKDYWNTNFSGANVGKVAVLGDNLKYQPLSVNAVDAQLIEQLQWTAETIAACYHVPFALIDSRQTGNTNQLSNEPLLQLYYAQCLQSLMTAIEISLDEGLGLGPGFANTYGTEFDIDDLIWMDTATKTKAAADSIGAGAISPNEARKKYFGLGPVKGGGSPYLQQQNFSLAALAERDANDPFAKPAPAPAAPTPTADDEITAAHVIAVQRKALDLSRALAGEIHRAA